MEKESEEFEIIKCLAELYVHSTSEEQIQKLVELDKTKTESEFYEYLVGVVADVLIDNGEYVLAQNLLETMIKRGKLVEKCNVYLYVMNDAGFIKVSKKREIEILKSAAKDKGMIYYFLQDRLGEYYLKHNDNKKAKECFLNALEDPETNGGVLISLFSIYTKENPNDENKKELHDLIELIKKYAEKGIGCAEYLISYCYKIGKGVVEDQEIAKKYLIRSADHGFETAIETIREMGEDT